MTHHHASICTTAALVTIFSITPLAAVTPPWGDWSLDLDSDTPAWMRVTEQDGEPVVRFRLHVGSDGPYRAVRNDDGRFEFDLKTPRRSSIRRKVVVGMEGETVRGVVQTDHPDGRHDHDAFTGRRIPDPPGDAPDLSRVAFGHPIALFNGRDLQGWRPNEPDKINGWSVVDGELVNSTPKTDFSSTGAHANLRTEAEFEDFWLHLEFLVERDRNSGVYLRGMYEAQVVDRDSRMQGIQGPGAIFGQITPSVNAGRPGGHWQTYDLTLVNRHITVVLNGQRVIDNQLVDAPTAGAIQTDPTRPGPILLQGDHTAVRYRNLYLAPVKTASRSASDPR